MSRVLLALGILGAVSAAVAETATVSYAQTGQALVANATNQPPTPAARGPSLKASLDAAQLAVKTCQGLEQNVGVTVVDSAGIPKVVLATDGASPRGVQSSTNKALTALVFRSATSALGERSKTDIDLAAKLAANPAYNKNAGGLLITSGGEVIGAVGVGGAKGSEKDEACAKAAVEELLAAH